MTIDVFPTIAPNLLGSPHAGTWLTNTFNALYGGAPSAGTVGTPGYYAVAPAVIPVDDVLVTTFASWRGIASPGTAFGSDFAAEQGNRLLYSFVITGHGQQFSLSQLSFTLVSSDPQNVLGFTFAGGSFNHNAGYVGVRYGADGLFGGGDDTFITSGANTQPVDALVGRGSGTAWWPTHENGDGLTDQQVLNNAIASIAVATPILATGTYSLDLGGGTIVSSQASVTIIPEPATYGLLLAGVSIGFTIWRRGRTR